MGFHRPFFPGYLSYPDQSDYSTNAPTYADDLARKAKLIQLLAEKIYNYDKELALRFAAWDKNLEEFDDEVLRLLQEWMQDGTLDHIINDTIFSWKLDKADFDLYKTEIRNIHLEHEKQINLRQEISKLPFVDVKQLKDRDKLTYTEAFQKGLDMAKTAGGVHLIFPPNERVVLTAELKVYSNTIIEASSGVRFVREHGGYMLMTGNRKTEPNPSTFGLYNGYGNISIIGGVWDANGVRFTSKASIFHFAHGDGFIVRDTTLLDCANSHHIEFNACKDIHVTNVKFLGMVGSTSNAVEALQLDVAKLGSTFIGQDDGTPCKDVWISECYFGRGNTVGSGNIPRGIGSHTATADGIMTNINILNNTFDNCTSFAIRCFNYEYVTISGNTFINCGAGINIRANMTGINTENKLGVQVGAQEIRGFVINQNIFEGWMGSGRLIEVYGERGTSGWIRGVTVSGNIINMEGEGSTFDAICFVVCENVSCINNSIKNGKGSAIALNTANSVILQGNDINTVGDDAIQVIDSYYTVVEGNTVLKAGSNGIYFSGSEAMTISNNIISGVNGLKITVDPKNHIRIVTACKLGTISGNIFRNFSTSFVTPNCIQVTSTCLNFIVRNNIGIGFSFSEVNPTNKTVDANGNMA